MPAIPYATLLHLVPGHARPRTPAEREARRIRRQARKAAWLAFIEAVFDGAPRHPVLPQDHRER